MQEIDKLKAGLGAGSVEEVLQKALGLAKLAISHADAENNLKLGHGDKVIDVNLRT